MQTIRITLTATRVVQYVPELYPGLDLADVLEREVDAADEAFDLRRYFSDVWVDGVIETDEESEGV